MSPSDSSIFFIFSSGLLSGYGPFINERWPAWSTVPLRLKVKSKMDAKYFYDNLPKRSVLVTSLPLSTQISKEEKVSVQFPLPTVQAQAISLPLQRSSPPLTSLSLTGAPGERERKRAAAERPSAAQERDSEQ